MPQHRPKSKEVRALLRTLEQRGAEVTTTRKGHLRVRGPEGIAIIPPAFGSPRGRANALATLATCAGVDLRRACEA
jgi:hypothetical protein